MLTNLSLAAKGEANLGNLALGEPCAGVWNGMQPQDWGHEGQPI